MLFLITFCFIALDMLTGLIKAFATKSYTSSVMREGLFHKCGSVICMGLGYMVDYAQKFLDLGISAPLTTFISGYIILMEIGSIIENVCIINPQILPKKLKSCFSKLTDTE